MYVILGVFALISWLVGMRLKSKFNQYSQETFRANLSGAEIAAKMLADNGINDVKIISVEGELTDHYNPQNKTVNLSPSVYHGRSVAAAAVAAHECGHAVQHARAYAWLTMRSNLVPVVNVASRLVNFVILAGVILLAFAPLIGSVVVLIGIVLFGATTLFSLITLPVEFDASNRALAWLDSSGVTASQEHEKAKDALWWAAMTYVVAALASLATLLYYVWMFFGGRRDD
ncbi:MAG TPA: zinc metallopeptidase [Chitinophagales bacterium]|nr:zinc metallopeptidase [Chitinophagales bacterium]